MTLRVLALDAYHTGSHRAFMEGWRLRSRHDWTLLTLPGRHWKWRMRAGAVRLAGEVRQKLRTEGPWDVIVATGMLNLAELGGLLPTALARRPRVLYMHENQLTYPASPDGPRDGAERDLHFGVTNIVSALAADVVWWNSAFNRDSFLRAIDDLGGVLPEGGFPGASAAIGARSCVQPPGIDAAAVPARPAGRPPGPLRIAWAARWEHDKAPEAFFAALAPLAAAGAPFRLVVLGERFAEAPAVFEHARARFARWIDRWGDAPDRADYLATLAGADVVVSTARHEFFGLSVVEAAAAGCVPLVPRRLAYPEVLGTHRPEVFYDDGSDLTARLFELAAAASSGAEPVPSDLIAHARAAGGRHDWSVRGPALDAALEHAAARPRLADATA